MLETNGKPFNSYHDLQRLCREIALEVGAPRFYEEKWQAVGQSRHTFEGNNDVRECFEIAMAQGHFAGHGAVHLRNVAIDAGALVIIEAGDRDRLVFLAHMAGVLHDIRRSQPDHARLGALAAEKILEEFAISEVERDMITQAIANHEAFQPVRVLDNSEAQLLSDALYDADKFRWGPENFTDTLWDILESRKLEDLSLLYKRFPRGLEGIRQIRSTFRTPAGRTYGPDFIDRGIEIGNQFYSKWRSSQKYDCISNNTT